MAEHGRVRSCYLGNALYEELNRLSSSWGLSRSEVISEALRFYIALNGNPVVASSIKHFAVADNETVGVYVERVLAEHVARRTDAELGTDKP